jgi:hypothetical protein
MKACFAVAFALAGCIGVQGGQEGEEEPRCLYDQVVTLSDPDAIAEGFAASPRELFAPAAARFSGRLENGRAVAIAFQANYTALRAVYAPTSPADCVASLKTSAAASLTVEGAADGQTLTVEDASLEVRFGEPLAQARFPSADTPLASVVPTFSGEPVTAPMLDVWLTDVQPANSDSSWQWSVFVACEQGAMCTGGPLPGATQPTSGAEVSWGRVRLIREE